MKTQLLPLALLLLFTACKTRHVAATKTNTTTTTQLTQTSKQNTLTIDTGKKSINTLINKSSTDTIEVDITPDSGSIQKIRMVAGGIFSYSGKAKSIRYKQKSGNYQQIDQSIQQNSGRITESTLADSTVQSQTTKQITKSKVTDAEATYGWVIWLLAILVLLCACGYAIYRFKYYKYFFKISRHIK